MGDIGSVRKTCLAVATIVLAGSLAGGETLALDVVKRSSGSGAPTTFGAPWYVADALGFFEKEGIKFEEVQVKGDANSMRALIAKEVLIGGVGPTTMFSALAEGAKVKVVVSSQPVVDYNIVAKKGIAKSLADIKTASFASAGPKDITTEIPKMVFKKHNVDPAGLNFIQVGSHAARLQSVIAGRVQATMVNTLTATQGKLAGEVDILATVAKDFPGLGYTYLAVREEDLTDAKTRKMIRGFVKGTILGARFVQENPDKAAEIMAKLLKDVDVKLIAAVFRQLNEDGVWGVDGGVEPHITDFTVKVQMEMGDLKQPLTVPQVLDRSVVEDVLKEIGPYKKKSS